jgi:UDP-N-acetyl-D-mannosaminuronic acid dehydrogenase
MSHLSSSASVVPEERAAVVGIGYVGLTLMCALARAGLRPIGYDIDQDKVDRAGRGEMPFEGAEAALDDLLRDLAGKRAFTTTSAADDLADATAVFIAVETPVDPSDNKPRYRALKAALEGIAPHLSRGVLVVVESTIAPGTMGGLVQPAIDGARGWTVGVDYNLVHCPERVMPSRLLQNISTTDRVVGGATPECALRATAIYEHVTSGALHPTTALAAEISKTAENAYRDVQIAFANELALICEELGADVYEVRELVNSSPGRNVHLPGAGVGGHCIPKDPWLLCAPIEGFQPTLMPSARAINDAMPLHLVKLIQQALDAEGKALSGSIVAVWGAAYLENTDDLRNTPALPCLRALAEAGAQVRLVDPHVDRLEEFEAGSDPIAAATGADAVALVTAHREFAEIDLGTLAGALRTKVLVDGRKVFEPALARDAGLRFLAIGRGPHML